VAVTAVLGIDPSLTATATCWIDGEAPPKLEMGRTKPTGQDALAKLARMKRQAEFASSYAGASKVVLIEAPSLASAGRATRDLAGLWWVMFAELIRHAPVVGVVPPSVLKKWTTGAGNADKFRVGQHIAKRWPDVELLGDDQSDALVLASIGLHHLDALPWTPTAFQVEALGKVEWNVR
jgi:crossover junction endodeoxyribonuclease RuvC